MIISCVKWGNKFTHKHVNRLYDMCVKYIDDIHFVCHTEDPTGLYPNIQIKELDLNLDLEKWWWKLTLFNEYHWPQSKKDTHLFFDLDVVIQDNFVSLLDHVKQDKLTMVKAYWKSYDLDYPDMNNNSSVMAWSGDLSYLWRKFTKDPEYYLIKYNGIDGFLTHECKSYIKTFPKGLIYSRLFGVDKKNCFEPIDDNQPDKLFFREDYTICIFNGWRREKYPTGEYWLDDDAYQGMEYCWQSEWMIKNHSGIDRNLWSALWECSISGGDVNHFLDSISPNQYESKVWLINTIEKFTQVNDIQRIQLYGGWFAHPITTIIQAAFPKIEWIENIDLDDEALHVCRLINKDVPFDLSTYNRNVIEKGDRDYDVDLVINTSSEHMPPLPVLIHNKEYRTMADNTARRPCMFAIQSNNMFHVKDHINCVNNEDELVNMCQFTKLLYKGSLDMPNGYKRFMVIGYV